MEEGVKKEGEEDSWNEDEESPPKMGNKEESVRAKMRFKNALKKKRSKLSVIKPDLTQCRHVELHKTFQSWDQ